MSEIGLRMMGKDPEGDARGVEVTNEGALKTQLTASKLYSGKVTVGAGSRKVIVNKVPHTKVSIMVRAQSEHDFSARIEARNTGSLGTGFKNARNSTAVIKRDSIVQDVLILPWSDKKADIVTEETEISIINDSDSDKEYDVQVYGHDAIVSNDEGATQELFIGEITLPAKTTTTLADYVPTNHVTVAVNAENDNDFFVRLRTRNRGGSFGIDYQGVGNSEVIINPDETITKVLFLPWSDPRAKIYVPTTNVELRNDSDEEQRYHVRVIGVNGDSENRLVAEDIDGNRAAITAARDPEGNAAIRTVNAAPDAYIEDKDRFKVTSVGFPTYIDVEFGDLGDNESVTKEIIPPANEIWEVQGINCDFRPTSELRIEISLRSPSLHLGRILNIDTTSNFNMFHNYLNYDEDNSTIRTSKNPEYYHQVLRGLMLSDNNTLRFDLSNRGSQVQDNLRNMRIHFVRYVYA